MQGKVDAVTLAVVAGVFESTPKEMAVIVERTARSPVIKDSHDYSDALFDWSGRLVSMGDDLPCMVGSMMYSAKAVADYFHDDIYPGDIVLHNDPATGGGHLPDITVFKPIFHEGQLMFWAGQKSHVIDVGGITPGGVAPNAEELYQEGLRIPPLKIYERGKERKDVVEFIMANVRYPQAETADLKAQIAATVTAERNLLRLVEKYSRQTVIDCTEEWYDVQERLMRKQVSRWQQGVFSGVSWKESVHGSPDLEVKAELTIQDSGISIRLDSPKQVAAYCNSYYGNTISGVYLGILLFTELKPPYNEGLFRPISIDCGPLGTMVNAQVPAPCSKATGPPFQAVVDAVRDALSKAVPFECLHAGWARSWWNFVSGISPRDGLRYSAIQTSASLGGAGALAGMDGRPCLGTQTCLGGLKGVDKERIEYEYPLRVYKDEFGVDSGCAGKWRGGLALEYEFGPVGHSCRFTAAGEGQKFLAMNLGGARSRLIEPKLAARYLLSEGKKTPVPPDSVIEVADGERILTRAKGGGGVGDPYERDIEAVRIDVRDEVVSIEGAREDYGVVIDPSTLAVDQEATRRLRQESGIVRDRHL